MSCGHRNVMCIYLSIYIPSLSFSLFLSLSNMFSDLEKSLKFSKNRSLSGQTISTVTEIVAHSFHLSVHERMVLMFIILDIEIDGMFLQAKFQYLHRIYIFIYLNLLTLISSSHPFVYVCTCALIVRTNSY